MIKSKIITPFQKFVNIESFSGVLLLFATILALVWANSPLGNIYQAIWQQDIGFTIANFTLHKALILWINDGLMAIFFFLIGLEIKREFLIGELNTAKKLSFPIFGALGGMLVPTLLFTFLNESEVTSSGWGIPMATDIAFSLAILKVLGNRVPLSLKVFLTAFAIVDDIGAVAVIAIFYSSDISLNLLLAAGVLLLILFLLSYKGLYSKYILFTVGIVVWFLFLKSGIHPTIAGILLAFSVPVRQRIRTAKFIDNLTDIVHNIKKAKVSSDPVLSKEQIQHVDDLENWTSQFQSPLQHLEHKLHDWVAYFIIPVFALANAGVVFSSTAWLDYSLITNIIICLILGNSIGICTIIFSVKKLGIIEVPSDISNCHIIGTSFLAGVGFTMAIFIASLAFPGNPVLIDSAKIGILIGSLASAVIGYLILRLGSAKQLEND